MGMFQNFMLKQMLKSKMKGVPESEQERILALVEKNPDFFKKIGEEVEKRKKSGQSDLEATMAVMREHQSELQKLMM
ncbi:MAG: hypothetical protein V4465_01690 [Patescibacteria group bacterium]